MKRDELTSIKATILRITSVGLATMEVSAFSLKTRAYAGKAEAVSLFRIERGARTVKGFVFTDDHEVVVIEGWNHGVKNELPVDAMVYCGETLSAREQMDAICAKAHVLADLRGHKTSGLGVSPKFAF